MLVLIQAILSVVGEILGIAQTILGLTQTAAQEHKTYNIETITTNTQLAIANPTYGLQAIMTKLNSMGTGGTTDLTPVLTAVSNVRQDLGAPHLPTLQDVLDRLAPGTLDPTNTTPPAWITPPPTPPTAGDIRDQVWQMQSIEESQTGDGDYYTMESLLEGCMRFARSVVSMQGIQSPTSPYFAMVAYIPFRLGTYGDDWVRWTNGTGPPAPDWSAVLATDTVLTFLQRTQPTLGWVASTPFGQATADVAYSESLGGMFYWRTTFSTMDMHQLASLVAGGGGSGGSSVVVPPQPPIWPGLAGVTLGTAVDLADGLTVTGPLDGVLVTVTSTRPGAGKYAFGSTISWTKVGGVIFASDHGEYEWAQSIGLDAQVVTPKTMKRAASARFRVEQAATGVVQPWTIDPPP